MDEAQLVESMARFEAFLRKELQGRAISESDIHLRLEAVKKERRYLIAGMHATVLSSHAFQDREDWVPHRFLASDNSKAAMKGLVDVCTMELFVIPIEDY